ncbi:MAG: hypothetical protein AUK48_14180 [Oscillatoriales cyanobacterium CG2_30_44_21]|nr:MAG: hypothetical protein AUK48_14180 [Oscillatoriales cyanobacterium CG2_30_44_21]
MKFLFLKNFSSVAYDRCSAVKEETDFWRRNGATPPKIQNQSALIPQPLLPEREKGSKQHF